MAGLLGGVRSDSTSDRLELHDFLPEHRQDALTRLGGILDELLRHHEYPEDVMQIVCVRLEEWQRKWNARGVQRGGSFSEFQFASIPDAVKEGMNIAQQVAARQSQSGEMLPPGKKG
tara:strand:- start:461 stop:811 length:351 start_codon:yes stop_codon:yes gene_type:complete